MLRARRDQHPQQLGEPPPEGNGSTGDGDLTDAEILGVLHVANQGEISTGEQAQRKAESAAVRDFGARMVAEHTALDESLKALGAQLGVAPAPSDVSAWLQGTAEHIETATEPYTGASYDVLYTDGQLFLHATVTGLLDWFASEADAPELRDAINAARPTILDHLQSATELRNQLGDPPAPLVK